MKLGVLRHARRPPASLRTPNFQAKFRLVALSLSSPPDILIMEKEMRPDGCPEYFVFLVVFINERALV